MMKHLKIILRLMHQHENRTNLDVFICIILHLYWSLCMVCFIKGAFQQEGVLNQAKLLTLSFSMIGRFASYSVIILGKGKYYEAICTLERHYEASKLNNEAIASLLETNDSLAEKSLKKFTLLIYLNVIVFATEPLSRAIYNLMTGKVIHNVWEQCTFSVGFCYPWLGATNSMTVTSFFVQIVHFHVMVVITLVDTAVAMYFIMTSVAFFQNTTQKFKEIGDEKADEAWIRLRSAIKSHVEALAFLEKVKHLGSVHYFITMYSGAAVLSFWCFVAVANSSLDNIVVCIPLVLSASTVLLILCHFGQKVIDENVKLINAIYDVPWYGANPKFRRALLFCLARAQRTDPVRAWKFWPLSYETYKSVIATAYSYTTFLSTVTEK